TGLTWTLDPNSVATILFTAEVANNRLTIIPLPNQYGQDDVTLWLNDPKGSQDTKADVTVIVAPVNDPPVIDPACDDFTTSEDTPADFDLSPYGSDMDDTGLTWSIDPDTVDTASDGGLVFTAEVVNNRLTIIPLPNQYGQDDVTLILTDPNGAQDTKADVTVIVAPVNDPPVIDPAGDDFTTPEDTPAGFDLSPYGSDVDDTGLTWSIDPDTVDTASDGGLVFTAEVVNNRLTIIPLPNQYGQDDVTLILTNPNGAQDTKADVTVIVAPVNDPPVIDPAGDDFTTPEDTPAGFDLSPYGSDVDDTGLTWSIDLDTVDTASDGGLVFTAEVVNNRLTIIPLPNQYGQDDVTLILTDPNGEQDSKADVTVIINEIARATIVRPTPGTRVSGDGVIVMADGGVVIDSVLFQYRASSDSTWLDIDRSDSPQSTVHSPQKKANSRPSVVGRGPRTIPHSAFKVTWDTSKLPDGEYQLRAVAEDTDGNTDPKPSFIRVIVNHSKNDYVEGKVDFTQLTVVDKGDGTKVTVPAGALKQETVVRISSPAPETLPSPKENPTGIYVDVSLEDSEAQLTEPIIISMAYEDSDNNGIVDGKEILEETLVIHQWDGQGWLALPTTVYAEDNICTAATEHLSLFSLFGKAASGLDKVLVYPNPFRPARDATVKFLGLSFEATIRIYNIAGELVWIKEDITTGSTEWKGRNDYGRAVASGVYLYLITDKNGGRRSGKLALIR
ncbi:MAG: Ig-like domain-containing protein, partial [bacterium]